LCALNGILIPILKDATGATRVNRWDFGAQYHVLLEHSNITEEQVLLWGEDCMLWCTNTLPISGVTYKRQDHEQILSTANISCSIGLNIKIDKKYCESYWR
jgi:hypothetical protein